MRPSPLLPRLWLPALLATTASLPTHSPAQEAPGEKATKCMVWRYKGEKATIYIAGSIHVLREDDYPLPSPYAAAYEEASKLVFEIPPKEVNSPETALKMQKAGTYPEGKSLDDHLDEETAEAVDSYLKEAGMPAAVKRSRPWMFALMVTMLETMKMGALPQFGVDHHFGTKASDDKKGTDGLETVDDQVSLFADLPADVQKQMLKKTMADLPEIGEQFKKMLDAWKIGDTKALHDLMFEDAEKFPKLMDALLLTRNQNWVDQIVGYLKGDENIMIIVGAGHLAGEGSVIDLLEKEGFKGEQLTYLAAGKAVEK